MLQVASRARPVMGGRGDDPELEVEIVSALIGLATSVVLAVEAPSP